MDGFFNHTPIFRMLFKGWLQEYLTNLNSSVDGDLVEYIIGLLDDLNEDEEDVKEALAGLLGELVNSDLECHCALILNKYKELSNSHGGDNCTESKSTPDSNEAECLDSVTAQMKEIINLDKAKVIPHKKHASTKDRIKLHANEGEVSTTDEESDSNDETSPDKQSEEKSASFTGRLQLKEIDDDDESETDEELEREIKNMSGASNREQVIKLQQEQREKQRAESSKKKEMDKTSRAKQLDQQKARKESEKKRTQKGERRR